MFIVGPSFSVRQSLELFFCRLFSLIGRSSRAEFGWGVLLYILFDRMTLLFVSLFAEKITGDLHAFDEIFALVSWGVYCIFILPLVVRRLHDRDLPALLALPFALPGGVGLLLCACLWFVPSQHMTNRYGIDPDWDPEGHLEYYTSRYHVKYKAAYGVKPKP